MAIVFRNAGFAGATFTTVVSQAVTITGTNTCIFIGAISNVTPNTIASVTCNGVACAVIPGTTMTNLDALTPTYFTCYYLAAPTSGNLVVTWNNNLAGAGGDVAWAQYSGVNQATPFESVQSALSVSGSTISLNTVTPTSATNWILTFDGASAGGITNSVPGTMANRTNITVYDFFDSNGTVPAAAFNQTFVMPAQRGLTLISWAIVEGGAAVTQNNAPFFMQMLSM